MLSPGRASYLWSWGFLWRSPACPLRLDAHRPYPPLPASCAATQIDRGSRVLRTALAETSLRRQLHRVGPQECIPASRAGKQSQVCLLVETSCSSSDSKSLQQNRGTETSPLASPVKTECQACPIPVPSGTKERSPSRKRWG